MTLDILAPPFVHGKQVHEGLPVTIKHWQLRDLVSWKSNEEIYAVKGASIVAYHPFSSGTESVEIGFHASCMCYHSGYLAAGGETGEVEDFVNVNGLVLGWNMK